MANVIRYQEWEASHGPDGVTELHQFFRGVAEARFVIRRVTRMVDEQARSHGLEPLEHQLLIQLYGAPDQVLHINRLGERLDVKPAVASRLVKRLEEAGMLHRSKSLEDRRVTEVRLTEEGRAAVAAIWEGVRPHLEYFQRLLEPEAKHVALGVFGYYVGVALDIDGDALTISRESAAGT